MTIAHLFHDNQSSLLWHSSIKPMTTACHSFDNRSSFFSWFHVISLKASCHFIRIRLPYGAKVWVTYRHKQGPHDATFCSILHTRTDEMSYSWEHGLISRRKFRAISSARLWRHRLYTCALSTSSSATTLYGVLILRRASRLDAFSAYPGQTQIPGGAPGGTTGKPEVCPSRSSRTSDGSTQNSCAHDR